VLGVLVVLLSVGFAAAGTPQANESIVVSSADDVVDGDTSSPSALAAHPGPDGISLREAILAADNAPAGAHVYVRFADTLAGSTIQLTQAAPLLLTHDRLTIEGLISGGEPTVTVVASSTWPACAIFLVEASTVTIRRLAFFGGGPDGVIALLVRGGTGRGGSASDSPCLSAPGPSTVSDVDVDENTFTNLSGSFAHRIFITNGNAAIDRVHISGNTFTNTNGGDDGDAILASNWASSSSIDALTIAENRFEGVSFGVELQPATSGDHWVDSPATGDQIIDTRISKNVFDHSGNPIWIGTLAFGDLASGNVITGSVIDANVFEMGSAQSGITLTAGSLNASGNSIADTTIEDNILAGDQPWIYLSGGGGGDASNNDVSNVEILNDTVVSHTASPALWSNSTYGSGTGNSVTGLDVRNTIFWGPGWPFNGDITTSNVQFSIATQPGFAGTNGNIAADPRFVDAAGGDYHLTAPSPAVDAGTSNSTPVFDLDDQARVNLPDIGAYEFGATPRPRLSIDTEQLGGSGVVTSTPAGIDCATECSAAFDQGAAVSLSATADAGSRFVGWSGGCAGSADCQVTLGAAESVTAIFAAQQAPSLSGFSPTGGTTGTTVAITGSSFTGATSVTFGGTAAESFSVESDTRITAAVAAGTATGEIAVTTAEGTATSSGAFTFFSAPTITSFTPSSGGPHATVTVTGTNLTGTTHVSLNGMSAPCSVVSATKLTFTVPVGATSGTIAVTTPGGTATSGGSFTVSPPPAVTSISPGSGPIGTTVTLTGSHLTGTVGVMLGSVITVPTSVDDSHVTFTVPPGAGSGQVKILNPAGSAISPGTFTVTP
jgi:hypothetical protein